MANTISDTITIRAGDTEPLDINVGATGLADLTSVSTAVLYVRAKGASALHVDGGALTIPDTAALVVRFDPVGQKVGGGNAFDAQGWYFCHVKLTHTDGDITRHPGDGWLALNATEALG